MHGSVNIRMVQSKDGMGASQISYLVSEDVGVHGRL